MSVNKQQGDLCESIAISYYIGKGFTVSKPINHSSDYDLIVDDGTSLKRVECKSSRYKHSNTSYSVALRTSGGNSSWNGVVKRLSHNTSDLIFIYTIDGNIYEIPTVILSGRNTINLNSQSQYFISNMSLFNFSE